MEVVQSGICEICGPCGHGRHIDRRAALQAMVAVTGLPVLASSLAAQQPQPINRPVVQFPVVGPRAPRPTPTCCIPRRTGPGSFPRRAGHARGAGGHDHRRREIAVGERRGSSAWISEYVSAPYDGQMRDLIRVQGGLAWLNVERKRFEGLSSGHRCRAHLICDDICYLPRAKPEFQSAARFFDLVQDLTAVGFYTTDAGCATCSTSGTWRCRSWPPPEVLKHLGLA